MHPFLPQTRSPRTAAWILSLGAALAVSATTPPNPPAAAIPPASQADASAPTPDLASVPMLPLLSSLPPPSSSTAPQAAPSGLPGSDSTRSELHVAYRLDLMNMHLRPPVFLNQDAAMIIANELQLGVSIFVVAHDAIHQGRPVLEVGAQIDEKQEGASSPYLLLCDAGHYSLLLPSEAPPQFMGFYLHEAGIYKGYGETALDPGKGIEGGPRRVPADGNCLITCLHFLKHGRFPDPSEIFRLRSLVSGKLTEDQVADALGAMRSHLILHALETPFEGGAFPGYGPLTSDLLQTRDSDFIARRRKALEAYLDQAAAANAWRAAQQAKEQDPRRAAAEAQLARERESKALSPEQRALVEAYRKDLLEAVPPIHLDLELAPYLAAEMGDPYVSIAEVTPDLMAGKPIIRTIARINADQPDLDDRRCLLIENGHCKVLERLPEGGAHRHAAFYTDEDGPRGYLEPSFPDLDAGRKPVPADGNSLLNAMYALQEEEFPNIWEITKIKFGVNGRLSHSRVLIILDKLRRELKAHPGERPFVTDRFPGCGPRTSALLAAEFGLVGPPPQASDRSREAKDSPKRPFLAEEEDPELAFALALSMEPPDTGGGRDGSSSPGATRPLKKPRS